MEHLFEHYPDWGGGHCLLVIAAPSDADIYECLRSLAQKWRHTLGAERLWIENDLRISSGLMLDLPPLAVQKILDAERELILRMELELGGLLLTFARTSGGGPFRQTYFDEIRIEQRSWDPVLEPTVTQLLDELRRSLHIGAAVLSEDLGELANRMGLPNISTVTGPLPF